MEKLHEEMEHFLTEIQETDKSHDSTWSKLRTFFIDLINQNKIFEPNTKTLRLIEKIRKTSGFRENFGLSIFGKVFPSIKYKFHLESKRPEKSSIVKIKPPSTKPHNSVRNKSFKVKEIDLSNIYQPMKSSRRSSPKKEQSQTKEIKEPTNKISDKRSVIRIKKMMEEDQEMDEGKHLIGLTNNKNPLKNPLAIHNDLEAIEYVTTVDRDVDEQVFHFGTYTNNHYEVNIVNEQPMTPEYQTLSRNGVFSIKENGKSEFTPLDRFVLSKAQFEMIKPIQLFSQFKIYKSFNFWSIRTKKSLLAKKERKFSVIAWCAMKPFPKVFVEYRKIIQTSLSLDLFPFNEQYSDHEFDVIRSSFFNAEENASKMITQISKSTYSLLDDFSFKIVDKYNFTSTPRSTNYLEDEKIPANLFMGTKCLSKRALSITEEKMMKAKREHDIEVAHRHAKTLQSFMHACDKIAIETFIRIFQRDMMKVVDIFMTKDSEKRFKVFLTFSSAKEEVCFSPSLKEMKDMIDEHVTLLFRSFNEFIRPLRVDTDGKREMRNENHESIKVPLRVILKNDPIFITFYDKLIKAIEDSYASADETLLLYKNPTLETYKFKKEWPIIKTSPEPQFFIKNITFLSHLKETIDSLKMTYIHKLLKVEVHGLKNDLLSVIDSLISENNSILFQNFRVICEQIVAEIQSYINTLILRGTTLEDLAFFNLQISNANAFYPEIKKSVHIVNSIFTRATECGNLLVAILENSLTNVQTTITAFDKALKESQEIMSLKREEAITQIMKRRKEIDNKIGAFERQMKRQFAIIDINMNPQVAIDDITATLQKIDSLKSIVKDFEVIASRLNFTDFDFTGLGRIENEMIQLRTHWCNFKEFTEEFNEIIGKNIIECNINQVIDFINNHSEKELRSINHPLYDKMAYMYASICEYLPFFILLSKIKFDESRWKSVCDILDMDFNKVRDKSIQKFVNPIIFERLEEIRAYIINLQQREDLIKSFNAVDEEFTSLSFKLITSNVTNSKIITFPSIYEANTSCEDFILSIKSLSKSPFFSTIEQKCNIIETKIKQAIAIINALINFQTDYLSICAMTKALFGSLHYPILSQQIRFVHSWYTSFIQQVEKDAHILSLIQNSGEQLESEISKSQDDSERSSRKLSSVTSSHSSFNKASKNFDNESIFFNEDYLHPIASSSTTNFVGDSLVECLEEAKSRCDAALDDVKELLDQIRASYPRLYFISDSELVGIIFACNNIRFSIDDFRPVFHSISKIHISTADTERIIGISNTLGEMYIFTSDFPIRRYTISDLLKKIESEMKNAVKTSISDAYSTRECTEVTKIYQKYPLQSILISEASFFFYTIREIRHTDYVRNSWTNLRISQERIITSLRNELEQNPDKSYYLSMLLTMKLRHLEIAREIERPFSISKDAYAFNKHVYPYVTNSASSELVTVTVGKEKILYGYELISEPDVFPLTDIEEQTMMNFAVSMGNPELSLCKQYGGNRSLVRAFAELIGIPFFRVNEECFDNIFAAVADVRAVVEIESINCLTPQFPQIFNYAENNAKHVKTESLYKTIDLNNNNFLIHIGTDKIPSWIQQRYRPIYVADEPKSTILNILKEARKEIKVSPTCQLTESLDIFSNIIMRQDAKQFIESEDPNQIYIKSKTKMFFDLPEFLLSGRLVTLEEPMQIMLPDNLLNLINTFSRQFEEFEITSPRVISNDFPLHAFSKSIMIYSQQSFIAQAIAYAAFGEGIGKIKIAAGYVSNDVDITTLNGFRPLNVEIHHKITDDNASDVVFVKKLTLKEFGSLIAQERSINECFMEIIPYIENLIAKRQSETVPDYLIYNELVTKVNLLRYMYTTDQSITMSRLVECIFTENYKGASIQESQLLLPTLGAKTPIIIEGPLSSGKRKFAKAFLYNHMKKRDIAIYSSPFNEDISYDVFRKLRFVNRGLYEPEEGRVIWVCILDYEHAIQEVKDFTKALIEFRSIYSREDYCFFRVNNIRLVITTTDSKQLLITRCPFYVIKMQEKETINWNILRAPFIDKEKKEALINAMNLFNKPSVVEQFLERCKENSTNVMDKKEDFLRVFSIFFGNDYAKKIVQLFGEEMSSVVECQNRNFNLAIFPKDLNFVSILSDVVNLHLNAILVLDNFNVSYFRYVKNTDFVILDPKFNSLLFKSLVRISQNKKRTTFIINVKHSNVNEAYDCLTFFNMLVDVPESATQYSSSDLKIFKYYINNDSNVSVSEAFRELTKYVSFFLLVDSEETLNTIPELLTKKMVILRPNPELNHTLRQTDNHCVDTIIPYIKDKIDEKSFEVVITSKIKELNEKFQVFGEEVQLLLSFFENITFLKEKIEIELTTSDIIVSDEIDLPNKLEQLQNKIKDVEEKRNNFFDQAQERAAKLQEVSRKLSGELPSQCAQLVNKIKAIDVTDQIEQINKWLATNDELFQFANIFKDLFGLMTTSNFTDTTSDGTNCLLTKEIINMSIISIDPSTANKLLKYNLNGDNPVAAVLAKSNLGKTQVSPLNYINLIIGWLHVVATSINLLDQRNSISAEITAFNQRTKTTQDSLNQLEDQLKRINEIIKKKNGSTDIPEWMMKVWKKDPDTVKKLFSTLEDSTILVLDIVREIGNTEMLIRPLISVYSGYCYGLCELPLEERKKMLEEANLMFMTSPFNFITGGICMHILFPLKNAMSIFTQCSPDRDPSMISMETGQIFNTVSMLDQMLFNNVLQYSGPNAFQQDAESSDLIPDPLIVFYDPQNICTQALTVNQIMATFAFSSADGIQDSIISSMSKGSTIIVQIDSVESGNMLFNFIKHLQLQLNATRGIQYNEQRKPVTYSFRLILVTTIEKKNFDFGSMNVVFANFSVDNVYDTFWFELATIFTINTKLSANFCATLNEVSKKTIDYYNTLRKLTEMSHVSWPEYFDNNQKMISLRSTLDHFIAAHKTLIEVTGNLTTYMEKDIKQYSKFTRLCKELAKSGNTHFSSFQVLTSLKIFMSNQITSKDFTPSEITNYFDEILLIYVQCLKPSEMIQFISMFEATHMKNNVPLHNLILEESFPAVYEKSTSTIFPQLINTICTGIINTKRDMFTFLTKDSLPEPITNPVVITVDELIPTDYVTQFINRNIPGKKITVSSFNTRPLTPQDAIPTLLMNCIETDTKLIIVCDDMLPAFVLPTILQFGHMFDYYKYYVIISKTCETKVRTITNALYVNMSRPYTMKGFSTFVRTMPENLSEINKLEGPLLYFVFLLAHRRDFNIRITHIIPLVRRCRKLWERNKNEFADAEKREYWKRFFTAIILSTSNDPIQRMTLEAQISYFFKTFEPSIPGISHIDVTNETLYTSEVVPPIINTGMMLSYGEELPTSAAFGWKKNLMKSSGSKQFYFSYKEEANVKSIAKIEKVRLSNAFWNKSELTIVGNTYIDEIFVYSGTLPEVRQQNNCVAGVYDASEFLGFINLPCSGNAEQWKMVGVRLFLH